MPDILNPSGRHNRSLPFAKIDVVSTAAMRTPHPQRVKTRIPPERSHVSFRRMRDWGRPRDFNARGRYCHGAEVERRPAFHSIPQALGVH